MKALFQMMKKLYIKIPKNVNRFYLMSASIRTRNLPQRSKSSQSLESRVINFSCDGNDILDTYFVQVICHFS